MLSQHCFNSFVPNAPFFHQKTVMFSGGRKRVHWERMGLVLQTDVVIVKGAVFGLRQFLTTESSQKMMKNVFYLFKKTLFVRYLNFCSDFFVHVGKRLVKKAKVNFQNL